MDREGPEHIAAFASPHATNEDLDALRHLLDALGVTRAAAAVVLGEGDEILLRPERAANARGARDRGFGDPAPVLDAIREGAVRVLLVMGHDLLAPSFLGSAAPLAALETVILLDTHRSALERVAQVVIPGLHLAEKGGSITNCEGFTQSVPAALAPAFEALPEARVLEALTLALGLPPRRAAA